MHPPFAPRPGKGVVVAGSTSGSPASIEAKGTCQIRVYNYSSDLCYVRFDGNTATSTDTPIGPGLTDVFTVWDCTSVSATMATTSAGFVFFQPGLGI